MAPVARPGASIWKRLSIRTEPVNQLSGPLIDGLLPLRMMVCSALLKEFTLSGLGLDAGANQLTAVVNQSSALMSFGLDGKMCIHLCSGG
ncbi:hypothetical protein D3C75_293990 [compost metagenome]